MKALNKIELELLVANGLLRSAYAVAERNGENTNWEPHRRNLREALERQLPIVNELKAGNDAFMVRIVDDEVRDLQGKLIGKIIAT